jgi:type II secretory pathway component PulJ
MMHIYKDEGGVSLIELLIALILTAALTTLVVSFSVDKLEQNAIQNTQYVLLTNAQTGLDRIGSDIRIASAADDNNRYQDPYSPGAPSNELSWASNSTTLILAVAATDSRNNVLWSDAQDYVSDKNDVIYYLSNGSIYRRVLADPVSGNAATTTCPTAHATTACPADSDVLDNVTSFSVEYFNSDNQQVTPSNARSIQLSVTLSVSKYNQNITANYTTRMVFRNG